MLSFPVPPMKAVMGSLPVNDDDRWAYEVKWDGFRAMAFVDGDQLRLHSTSLRNIADNYPELGGLPASVHASTAILDGELVAFDDSGLPRFELVQRHEQPVVFQAFDVLHLEGHDTTGLPYTDRRRLLEQVVEPGDAWLVPAHRVGGGAELFAATEAQGLEGVMAKRLDGVYQPGKRSPTWRKIKHRRRVEVTIGGFTAGAGNRASTFGALLIGRQVGDELVFAGGVGTGFDQAALEALTARLRELATDACPFAEAPAASYRATATWVEPVLRATIEIAEFTNDGFVRHASFIDLAS